MRGRQQTFVYGNTFIEPRTRFVRGDDHPRISFKHTEQRVELGILDLGEVSHAEEQQCRATRGGRLPFKDQQLPSLLYCVDDSSLVR